MVKTPDKYGRHVSYKWKQTNRKKIVREFFLKNKHFYIVAGSIIFLLIAGILVKTMFFTCPNSCDDGLKCTENYCSDETNYQCTHRDIIPCEGNNKCETGEYGTADCPDCNDNIKCTKDSVNFETLECTHEEIIPCEGNKICEIGEYGTKDCPSCEDNNKCTKDSINYESLKCVNKVITPCCGNGKIETGETCSSCKEDVKCSVGNQCCSGTCKSVCTKNSDCVSDDPAKEGSCTNANTCNSKCEYTLATTANIKTGEYRVHGFKFEVDLEEYGSKIEYLDRSGDEQYLGAQDGQKLLKYKIIVQCIEKDCNSFYTSSFSLMDDEGNVYSAKCPINWLGQCNNQDTVDSMYDPLENQKASGILIFSIPQKVDDVGLIYKFSSYIDNPKSLKFITKLN
ncbi:MAG: hypothetical protein KJ597_07145 [Nanoarchaeota archaeon]|nr:hypothetical protein [Nanoarchaeota archaeon]MBU1623320.1 hypothetical protein [Nanoarchaeota archaeon]